MTILRRARHFPGNQSLHLLVFCILFFLIAAMGGTSRYDSLLQAGVRVTCVGALAFAIVSRAPLIWTGLKAPAVFLALAVALLVLQSLPLPPALWTALSGRGFYLESASAAGLAQPWRPLSLVPDRGLSALFSMLVPVAILAAMARLSPKERALLLAPAVLLIALSAVLGVAQISLGQQSFLRWYEYSNDRSADGFFANRNHQALFLASALPIAAAWACHKVDPRRVWTRGWTALAVGVLIVLIVPTTGSRAGLVLAAIGVLAAVAIAAPTVRDHAAHVSPRRRKRVQRAFAGGIAIFIAVLVLFGRNESIRRLMDLDSADDLRAQTFPVIWRMTWEFFPAGIGFGSFDAVFRRVEPFSMLSTTYLNQAHNDILQLVLEGGLPALLVALAFVGWWGWVSVRVWRLPTSGRVLAGRAGSGVVGMSLIASAVDYPLRTPLLLGFFTVATCWLATAAATDRNPAPPPQDAP